MWSKTPLLALLAVSSIAQAGWLDDRVNEVMRRQDTNVSDTESSTSTPPVTTTPDETTPTETPTPSTSSSVSISTTPTPTPTPSASTTLPPSSTSSIITTPTLSSSSSVQEEEDSSSTTTSAPASSTSPSITPSRTIIRSTITRTVNGETITSVSESTSTMAPSATNEAGLANGSETTGGGMSSKTKSTVIGVVVGIGGAILLAGLAVVAWRIWGRKRSAEDGDDLMDYSRPDTGAEKMGSGSGGSREGGAAANPFQSTLESYHNPSKQVNASSNF